MPQIVETYIGSDDSLRIKHLGNFSSMDFGKLLIEIEELYNTFLVFDIISFHPRKDLDTLIGLDLSPGTVGDYLEKIASKEFTEHRGEYFERKRISTIAQIFRILDSPLTDVFEIKHINAIARELPKSFQLYLLRISYNSPGDIDFLGFGKVLKEVKEFVLGILDRILDRDKRKQDVIARKLDNMDKFLRIAGKHNLNDNQKDQLFKLLKGKEVSLAKLLSNKVESIETIDLNANRPF